MKQNKKKKKTMRNNLNMKLNSNTSYIQKFIQYIV